MSKFNAGRTLPILGCTAFVLSNDVLGAVKTAARLASVVFGARIQVCDGTADDEEMQAAIDALPSGGGKLRLSEGTFDLAAAVSVDQDSVKIEGGGIGVTTVRTTAAAIQAFDFGDGTTTRNDLSISSLTIDTTVTKTAGAAVRFNKCSRVRMQDFHIASHYIGIDLQTVTIAHIERGYIVNTVPTNGISVRIDGSGNDHFLSQLIADAPTASEPFAGLRILKSSATWIADCDFIHQSYGLLVDPQSGDAVEWLFVRDSAFDSNDLNGIFINPAAGGTVKGGTFIGCWTATNTDSGMVVGSTGTIDGLRFVGHRSFNNTQHGVVLNGGENISLDACDISGNSLGSSGTYHGIAIAAGVSEWAIRNCRIGQMAGFANTQGYAILLNATIGDNFAIENNDLRLNVTGGVAGATVSSTKLVRNNLGYVTENSGTATLADGTTSIAVTHGLGVTPAAGDVMVTPIEAWGAMTEFYIDTYTATQFTIHADQDPGQDVDFAWKALVL